MSGLSEEWAIGQVVLGVDLVITFLCTVSVRYLFEKCMAHSGGAEERQDDLRDSDRSCVMFGATLTVNAKEEREPCRQPGRAFHPFVPSASQPHVPSSSLYSNIRGSCTTACPTTESCRLSHTSMIDVTSSL